MKILLVLLTFCFSLSILAANPHVGIIVKKKGNVLIYTHASTTAKGPGVRVKLDNGMYYTESKARPGTKIGNGNILRTKGKNAKARVVYKNGDQFNVSPGSQYEIKWDKPKPGHKATTTVSLIYGSIRGIVSPKGPRNKLKVKTTNAVMGVRGTDFNFSKVGTAGNTYVSVIRGKVSVTDPKKPKQTISVAQGKSANVYSHTFLKQKKMKMVKTIQVSATTKNDLIRIQKNSTIRKLKPEDRKASKEVMAELKTLEQQAVKVTLEDIKTYQPKIYEELIKKKITSVSSLNSMVVKKAYKKAPAKKAKIGFEELDMNLDDNAYKKYFK